MAIVSASAGHLSAQDVEPATPLEIKWAKSINPIKIERTPVTAVEADSEGFAYALYSAGGKDFSADQNLPSLQAGASTAVLVKYTPLGQAVWQVQLKGGMVKGYQLAFDKESNKLYIAGTYDNTAPLGALNADGKTAAHTITTGGFSDDCFLACFSTEGQLQSLQNIGGAKDKSGEVTTAIEMPSGMAIVGKKLFLVINNENNTAAVNFTGEVVNPEKKPATYLLKLDKQTLAIEDVALLLADSKDEFDEIRLTALASYSDNRLFYTGNAAAPAIKYTNAKGEEARLEIKGAPWALFLGEWDTATNRAKELRALPINNDNGTQIPNTIAVAGEEPIMYIAGNTDGIPHAGSKVVGGFVMSWPVNASEPEKIFVVGGDKEENSVRKIVVDKGNKDIYATGFVRDQFKFNGTTIPAVGRSGDDCYIARINPKSGDIVKYAVFGATGSDDAGSICITPKKGLIYATGFYKGADFSIPNCQNVAEAKKSNHYYIGAWDANWLEGIERVVAESSSPLAYTRNGEIILFEGGNYTLYSLTGEVVARGKGEAGKSIAEGLSSDSYILVLNGTAQRLIVLR